MKRARITISFLLVLSLLLSALPHVAAVEAGEITAEPITETPSLTEEPIVTEPTSDSEITIIHEDISLRGEYEKHFLMSDGTYQAVVYNEPVHYETATGWAEIDNTLTLQTAADGTAHYTTADAVTDVSFSQSFGDQLVTMQQGDYSLAWGVQAVSNTPTLSTTEAELVTADLSAFSAEEQKTMAVKSSSTIQYRNALHQDVDLEYIVLPSRVKENIILNSPQDISGYVVTVYAENLTARLLENRQIEFVNANDEVIFTMASPYMYDSAGELSEDITVEMIQKGTGIYFICMTPSATWLSDDSRTYPITIDPQVSTSTVQQNIIDNYVMSGAGVQNNNLDRLYIGKKGGVLTRSYIKFSTMPTVPAGSIINSATMTLNIPSGTSSGYTASAYMVTGGDWGSGTITWANMPAATTLLQDNISHNNLTKYTFSCLTAVKHWYTGMPSGKYQNYGVMIRYYNEQANDYNAVYSADYTDESQRPSITINYQSSTEEISIQEGATYNLTVSSSATVTWASSNTSVATVSSSGVVTGVRAGQSTITATANGTTLHSCTVYVRLKDGVYRIKNSSSAVYIGTTGSIAGGTTTSLRTKATSNPTQLYQLWKIAHLGNGYYSIRPLYKLDTALGLNGANVALCTVGTTDSLSAVPTTSHWTITYSSLGYAIKRLGSNGLAMTPQNDAPASGTAVVVNGYSATNSARHWSLEQVSSPPAGALLYNTSTQAIVSNPSKYMAVGESKTLSDFNLCAIAYSEDTNSQDFYWYSDNTAVATINSTTSTVTGISPGIAVITGRISRGGIYHYVKFGVCVGFPTLFNDLIDIGCIPYTQCDTSGDGLFLSTVPVSEILIDKGITELPIDDTNSSTTKDASAYDDWYIYAIDNGVAVSYGLFKMRGNESGTIGVTISFISIDSDTLINCLKSPTRDAKYQLYVEINNATWPNLIHPHDDVLAQYFAQVESTGAYFIAEKFTSLIANSTNNGIIDIPQECVDLINETKNIDEPLINPFLDDDTRALLYLQRQECARIPDALKKLNETAGYTIYNDENLTLSIADPANLTLYEKQAILSCFTANVTFNSFAAEVEFHADAIYDWKSEYDEWYEAAIRADMAIGEEYESGFYNQYYDLDSDIVQAQINEHGEY